MTLSGTFECVVSGIPTGSVASRGSMEEFHQQFAVYRESGNSSGAEMAEECRGRRAAAFKATPEKVYARGIVTGSLNAKLPILKGKRRLPCGSLIRLALASERVDELDIPISRPETDGPETDAENRASILARHLPDVT
ncbi:hypothetical protein K0M31_009397 [Melipona bicolor]|uniref:Uncharacterized protein n=1 Tax=Melipona bicolor TaxID=60889 RepID=A0AA40FNH2_9HYME|nr:hypothetical protein K0M31_009397 [Melipona bicolor]